MPRHRHDLSHDSPPEPPRPRWGWLLIVTIVAAATGVWISGELG